MTTAATQGVLTALKAKRGRTTNLRGSRPAGRDRPRRRGPGDRADEGTHRGSSSLTRAVPVPAFLPLIKRVRRERGATSRVEITQQQTELTVSPAGLASNDSIKRRL